MIKWGLPKVIGIFIIYLAVIGIIAIAITLVFPFVKEQFLDLVKEFPTYIMQLFQSIQDFMKSSFVTSTLDRFGIDVTSVVDKTMNEFTQKITEWSSDVGSTLATGVGALSQR